VHSTLQVHPATILLALSKAKREPQN